MCWPESKVQYWRGKRAEPWSAYRRPITVCERTRACVRVRVCVCACVCETKRLNSTRALKYVLYLNLYMI